MKFLLVLAFVATLLPGGPMLAVDGEGPECTVTAFGMVEAFMIGHYAFEDPGKPGQWFTYATPIRILSNRAHSSIYDWLPVAIEWQGRAAGKGRRFKTHTVCGDIPDPVIFAPPESETPVLECVALADGPMDFFAVAYYLHEDPADPMVRYQYRTDIVTVADAETVGFELGFPVAVEWWYRDCGSLAHSRGGVWTLAKTCGVIPEPMAT